MKTSDELKTIAVKARHAYEELVLDAAYTDANRLLSGGAGAMWHFLKHHYGGRWRAVRALRAELRKAGEKVPQLDRHSFEDVLAEKRRIINSREWVLEETIYELKQQEAVQACDKLNTMLDYIRSHGGEDGVLLALRVAAQRDRRKTCVLE